FILYKSPLPLGEGRQPQMVHRDQGADAPRSPTWSFLEATSREGRGTLLVRLAASSVHHGNPVAVGLEREAEADPFQVRVKDWNAMVEAAHPKFDGFPRLVQRRDNTGLAGLAALGSVAGQLRIFVVDAKALHGWMIEVADHEVSVL